MGSKYRLIMCAEDEMINHTHENACIEQLENGYECCVCEALFTKEDVKANNDICPNCRTRQRWYKHKQR